ncbi:MAG TPA: hypothetical protein PKD63_11040 [Solirubrobacteraceae bacterium]|nr:hypothetical protein [Solirubrobacteraceae bacterium]
MGSLTDRRLMVAAGLRGRRRWRDPAERDRARRAMDAVAGPAADLDRLARRHLARDEQRESFIARPALIPGMPADGAEHLRAAHEHRRGVIASFCHHGPFPGVGISVAEQTGAPVHPVAGAWLAGPMSADLPERIRVWRAAYAAAGITPVDATGSFSRLRTILEDGEIITLAFDWPGTMPTTFLGRPVLMATGTARLAHRTGALVVPTRRSLRRWRPRTVFAPALDPRAHDDWEGLHRALAAVHEEWILEDPAALEDPRRTGAWGAGAVAEGWSAEGAGLGSAVQAQPNPDAT